MPPDDRPADQDDEPTAWQIAMAEHEKRLVVGARVRVRLSGECPWEHPAAYSDHLPNWSGKTGTIIDSVMVLGRRQGHPFTVRVDRWPDWPGLYAAAELIPLDPDR